MSQDWAIIVGVKDYWDNSFNTLEGPVSDAESFYNWLIDQRGGNIPANREPSEDNPSRIKLVKSNGRPEAASHARPTGDEVYAAGVDITDWLGRHRETGRRLYIYMNGHGCTPINAEQAESVALLMANASSTEALLNFPATACAKYMRRRGHFEEVVLIMDCCRSRASNAISPPYYVTYGDTTRGGHIVEAYATNWDSQAHEFCYPPAKQKRGAFTHALLDCLSSGKLTGSQLRQSVQVKVERDLIAQGFSEEAARLRQPQIHADPEKYLNEIWFSEGASPPRTRIEIRRYADMPQPEIYQTARFPPPRVNKKPGDPDDAFVWLLEPGSYGLKIGDKSREFTVYAALPQELEI
ncbi:MAG: hypothetical protein EOS82_24585 [Mesorhizobium sp.]|uniref:caspase family protein n=1 Tax=Mesorhizobium sp. TaxID=1871066 RepID=UPI000FE9AE8A|nr:caspase family protein [Mesorhizobium sp.]RWQ45535.1 MAG: hypothetical protein EOS82_24585 [Mesorhizobium sp.]